MRIWRDKHYKWFYRLEEFEGDEMWDYEGWDLFAEEEDPEEDIAWTKPQIKKPKKGKKGGKKGSKKGSKKGGKKKVKK